MAARRERRQDQVVSGRLQLAVDPDLGLGQHHDVDPRADLGRHLGQRELRQQLGVGPQQVEQHDQAGAHDRDDRQPDPRDPRHDLRDHRGLGALADGGLGVLVPLVDRQAVAQRQRHLSAAGQALSLLIDLLGEDLLHERAQLEPQRVAGRREEERAQRLAHLEGRLEAIVGILGQRP